MYHGESDEVVVREKHGPKSKKAKTTEEIETIVSEVEARKCTLFQSVYLGVTMVKKKKKSWAAITEAVNVVSPEIHSDKKEMVHVKKRITDQKKKKATGGRQGPPDLSAQDERLDTIIGQTPISGITPRNGRALAS